MEETSSVVIFTKASQMLAEADTIQKAKELKNLALTAADWAKRKGLGEEAIRYARSYALEAERKMGEMLVETERAQGRRTDLVDGHDQVDETPTLAELNLSKDESSRAQFMAGLPREMFDEIKSGEKSIMGIRRELRKKNAIHVDFPQGLYNVIVVDPPWPIEKIQRDCRPNQIEVDYDTMTLEEISGLQLPVAKNSHVWLWTTQRFLPDALRIFEAWSIHYVCTFVWHKPGGFQVVGLPQYNCEFSLYGRMGNPEFSNTKGLCTCFSAPRGKHSEKPEAFYAMIRNSTIGQRLDMFSRRAIQGFDSWGKEAPGK
jgi:N6-adenosine-specific RNA methylase IME4